MPVFCTLGAPGLTSFIGGGGGRTNVSGKQHSSRSGELFERNQLPLQIPVAERRGIPHHLIDVLEPKQDFSAGDFYVLSRAAIEDILKVTHSHLLDA
jgi:hypothetical protein